MGLHPRLVKSNAPDPKKRFGQHFLRDTGVREKIVRWIQPAPEDVFLEIGAGDGSLSSRIAPGVARLLAVEVDEDRIEGLREVLQPFQSARIVQGDILQLDLSGLIAGILPPGGQIRIAGNLPYNIATAIIGKLLHESLPVRDMFFMVQLEVAQRITAHPGSRQYGFLSVDCQHHAEVHFGFKVSPACFVPRPQVSSAMISLKPKKGEIEPFPEFEVVAKAAFSYRRKMLSNSLAKHPILGKAAHELLSRAGIDGGRRAEELSVQEYEKLARVYGEIKEAGDRSQKTE